MHAHIFFIKFNFLEDQSFEFLFILNKTEMGTSLRQIPITCSGHTRPVVDLKFSDITSSSYYLISACKGIEIFNHLILV